MGITITPLSVIIYKAGLTSIIDASNLYLGFIGGPLFGIFLLGVLTRRTKALPMVIGTVCSVGLMILLPTWQTSTEVVVFHPYLFSLLGCLLTMVLGYLASLISPELPYESIKFFTTAKKRTSRV